jgi:hypothetical protein
MMNKGVKLPTFVKIIGGRVNVKQSITQFIVWAKGIIRAGTTSGRYGHTNGPKVIPYIIIRSIYIVKIMAELN